MSQIEIPKPKVFISYKWTDEHFEWVTSLAERLVLNGVDVEYDRWSVKDGHDLNVFMEQMVNAPDIDRVLIICTSAYAEKANSREGGVGTETLIITPEVYENVRQEKFIPIIAEEDPDGKPILPSYLRGRKYINLTGEKFADGYEALLRNLFNRPSMQKPQLGSPPAFLFQDAPNTIKTEIQLEELGKAMKRGQNVSHAKRDFLHGLSETLEAYLIKPGEYRNAPIPDELIVDKFHTMLRLRDDIVEFLELTISSEDDVLPTVESLMGILASFCFTDNGEFQGQRDHYLLLTLEIFIYITTIVIEQEKYDFLRTLVTATYWVERRGLGEVSTDYTEFNQNARSIEQRNQRLNLRKYSLTGEILSDRATIKRYPKYKLVHAEKMLYFMGLIYEVDRPWFPRMWPYDDGMKISILNRLSSRRHFEKVKALFDVNEPTELRDKISEITYPYRLGDFRDVSIQQSIDPNSIGTLA